MASRQKASEGDNGLRLELDRGTWLVGGLLLTVAMLAWAGVVQSMGMSSTQTTDVVTFLLAWGVMMTAMMLPSATPMIALYGAVRRNAARTAHSGIPTAMFALVYLAVWLAF